MGLYQTNTALLKEIIIPKTHKYIKCSHQTKLVICLFFN